MDQLATTNRVAAWIVRVIGVGLPGVFVLLGLAFAPQVFFIYLTDWGLFLTFLIFVLILLSSCHRYIAFAGVKLLPVVWVLNAAITVGFWCIVFPVDPHMLGLGISILAHGPPFILTSLELWLDQVPIKRLDILVAVVVQTLYTLCVNLPYTLEDEEVYPDINYVNYFTYVGLATITIASVVIGECGHRIKRRILHNRREEAKEDLGGNLVVRG